MGRRRAETGTTQSDVEGDRQLVFDTDYSVFGDVRDASQLRAFNFAEVCPDLLVYLFFHCSLPIDSLTHCSLLPIDSLFTPY